MALSSTEATRLTSTLTPSRSSETRDDADALRATAADALWQLVGAGVVLVPPALPEEPHAAGTDFDAHPLRAGVKRHAQAGHGIARRRARALELWSRRVLRHETRPARGEYYGNVALPHQLRPTAGTATLAPDQSSHISLVNTGRWRHARRATEHRSMPSGFALPAFRAGSTIGHRLQRRYEAMANIIDRVAQPLALCAPSGRVLHRNPVLRQMADTDGQKQLLDAVNRVARAVAAAGTPARRRDPAMSATSEAVGSWRVVGSRLELESGRAAPTILVSLLPRASEAGSCKELRARYGLTSRELEVVQLLQLRRSNAEVASALGISEHTARHHTENVLLKLGLHSRTQIDERFAHRALNTDAGASISLA